MAKAKAQAQGGYLNNAQWGALILSIAVLNAWPYGFFTFGHDILIHYFHIDCYGREFWQGNLLATWCGSANAGYGSPAPMFYFPLPYLPTNLLYPLVELEAINTFQLFIIAIWIVNAVTFVGCLLWFQRYVSVKAAIFISLLYLWFPYRIELLTYRFAYAELWLMALLPYLFYLLDTMRAESHGRRSQLVWLTLLFATIILTHVPASIAIGIALILGFVTGYLPINILKQLILAGLAAVAITAPWWINIYQYGGFVAGADLENPLINWANRHPRLEDLRTGLIVNIFTSTVTTAGYFLVALYLLCYKQIRQHITLSRQLKMAMSCLVIGYLLYLPVSESLWNLAKSIPVLGDILFPWRMQIICVIGAMFVALVIMQASEKRLPTVGPLKANSWAFVFIVIWLFSTLGLSDSVHKYAPERLQQAMINVALTYRTKWADSRYDTAFLLQKSEDSSGRQIAMIEGNGKASISTLNSQHIDIDVDALSDVTLTLDHFYFPIWQVADGQPEVKLSPINDGSGLMQIEAPKGKYTIRLENKAQLF